MGNIFQSYGPLLTIGPAADGVLGFTDVRAMVSRFLLIFPRVQLNSILNVLRGDHLMLALGLRRLRRQFVIVQRNLDLNLVLNLELVTTAVLN